MPEEEIKITKSSGNVFADLGLPDADDLKFKTGLVIQIHKLINSRKLSQVQASRLVNVSQPKLSALLKGDFSGFSTDRLFKILQGLGQDIEIKITPAEKPTKIGTVTVLMPRTLRKSATVAAKAMHQASKKATAAKPKAKATVSAKGKTAIKATSKTKPRMQG